jgi:hypothetical protein
MANKQKLRHTLDLAKACVHRGQAPQALEHLKSIQSEIEDLAGSSFWAEHELIYAGALAGMNNHDAKLVFEDAIGRCTRLSEPDPALLMTAHCDYAIYLAGRRATANQACEHYRQAEQLADSLGLEESVAHFQMCVIGLDLQKTNSPQFAAFQKLQEASRDGYTEVQQREAWIHYTTELDGFGSQLVATRDGAKASTDYFRGVLSAIKRAPK